MLGPWAMVTEHPVIWTAIAVCFFGFGAGAILHLYLIATGSPLIQELRGSLDYKSSIIGDGLVLPAVGALIVASLLDHPDLITTATLGVALACGLAITAYFHVVQALEGIVNWAMPEPWRWNLLGAWHAAYMYAMTSLLSLFYVAAVYGFWAGRSLGLGAVALVTAGVLVFLALLRLDYVTIAWSQLVPQWVGRRPR